MAATMDLRAELAAALRRQVRDPNEWPLRDRRRFRNLLLDAASSDALPLAELLLRVHDDDLLVVFPDRNANRVAWDNATARLAGDLQTQCFLDSGVARFVAEAWASALGPDMIAVPRTVTPRPTYVPRPPMRTAATVRASVQSTSGGAPSAASLQAYRRSNMMFLFVAAVVTVLTILAFRSTGRRAEPAPAVSTTPVPAESPSSAVGASSRQSSGPRTVGAAVSGVSAPPDTASATARVVRPSVSVAPAPARTTDDIVLSAGRVFEGKVLSVRQQTIVVKDDETGLDFEIAKADVDRIVTRDGRIMRFGDDNVPLLGDDDALTPISRAGRYRVRWAERWGVQRGECAELARQFAPGNEIVVQHLRGAPMLKLAFVGGQAFNTAVRGDGLFESNADVAPVRGPRGAFVSTRLSGRFTRQGDLQGVARISAVQSNGSIVCDLALTMRGALSAR